MSWSFSAIGRSSAVAQKARDDLTRYKCTEPEETIKTKALEIIESSLCAMPDASAVQIEAYGSQSPVSGGVSNQLTLKITPISGFVGE